MANTIKELYRLHYYNDEDLPIFVQVGWITADEYKAMTGKDYVAPEV